MVVAAVVGDKILGLRSEITEDVVQVEDRFNLNLIVAGEWTRPPADVIPFQPIGLGKPLTVILETLYIGDYPDTLRVIPGDQRGDILVTSAHKPFQNFDGAARAIHLLQPKPERRDFLYATASAGGSQLIYYSPAVTDTNVLFTIEISADREFNDELADGLSEALSSAAALPVFAPAAPYLVSAGAAVKIGKKAADMLARPAPYYCETLHVNFGLAGRAASVASALLLWPGDDTAEVEGYTVDKDFRLRTPDGDLYKGAKPYAVLSLDGTKHEDLEGWTARAMSAVMLERFFEPKEAMQQTLDLATESLSLYNDVSYQRRALKAADAARAASGAERARQEKLVAAYSKNIQNADIRKTVEPEDEG
ncbi:hypothetical protein [Nocardioides sp. SR21]|uniref:hypothetical protein n=1 Tax=Nocardioides sp. SR21 TaxID=2919501 RepID=UPI001FAAF208|nr:hypothetical protein [Nocardioides sp. SR21]